MIRLTKAGLCMLTAVVATAFAGCAAEQDSETPTATSPPAESARDDDRTSDNSKEIEDALGTLSPEDRALAEKQNVCPVTGELLGSMGAPIKVTVKGRDVFVCCQGCVDELKNNFAKYEDKLR